MTTLLLVEDDPHIYRFLTPVLSAHGYQVRHTQQRASALTMLAQVAMVIVDLGLPDGDGADLITAIRQHSDIPILVLSAKQAEAEKVRCFHLGADDYLIKPFGHAELIARIQAALRRTAMMHMRDHVYQQAGLTIDRATGIVSKHGQALHLSPIEHALCMLLATKPGSIFTHAQLLSSVWGPEYINDTHYLRIHIGRLRAKLEDHPTQPRHVLTELGIGYRLAESQRG